MKFKQNKELLYDLALVLSKAELDEGDGYMAKIEMQSLNPLSKKSGGIGGLILVGAGVAVVGFVAMAGLNWINAGAEALDNATGFNLLSSVEGQSNGSEQLNTAGSLGVGSHPYSTVTFTRAVKDGAGVAFPSMTQYVWDSQPLNWGKVLTISDDYTTPQGAGGESIAIPQSATITNGVLTATLNTALGESNKVDGKGNLAVVDKRYYAFASMTSAPDLFFTVDVPSAGAVDSTSPTVVLPSVTNPRLDATAWTSSPVDLGLAGNLANTTMYGTVTYRIKDQNVSQVKSIAITDLNKMGNAGVLDYVKVNFQGLKGGEWKPYDYAQSIDQFVYGGSTFDATLNGTDRSPSDGILATLNAGENVNLQVEVKADVGTASANAFQNAQVLGVLKILDIEGNTLVSQNITG